MRLPRMTTQWWMIAVAQIGLILYTLISLYMFIQKPYCDDHGYIEIMRNRSLRPMREESARRWKMAEGHSKRAARSVGKHAEYHASMAAKWKEAASFPSRPVEPDPPPPEP
jgi:hypothetical protein